MCDLSTAVPGPEMESIISEALFEGCVGAPPWGLFPFLFLALLDRKAGMGLRLRPCDIHKH